MFPSNKGQPQKEAIVDKLHVALASFRRERDEVHRSKELAVERLRLVREERMEAEKTIQSMQQKYDQMIQSINFKEGSQDDEITKLQQEVERLSREARFQHGELVNKREKLNSLKTSVGEEDKKRSGYLRLARESVRKRREKVGIREANEDYNGSKESNDVEVIKECLRRNGDEFDIYSKLRRIMKKNADHVAVEAESIDQKSALLLKRIEGYRGFIKGQEMNAIDDSSNYAVVEMMEQ